MTDIEISTYNPNLIKSVMLLTLAVSGNFIGNTLSCKTQYYMTNNMYVKHLLILLIVYFTLNYSSNDNPNPIELIKNAFYIWVCYLMFTKQSITFTMIVACIFFSVYLLDSFVSYYNKLEKNEKTKSEIKNKIDSYSKYRNYLFKGGLATLLIGFISYFMEKKSEYGNDFNFTTFLFGKVQCDSLK
jgi:hypothetical protein